MVVVKMERGVKVANLMWKINKTGTRCKCIGMKLENLNKYIAKSFKKGLFV